MAADFRWLSLLISAVFFFYGAAITILCCCSIFVTAAGLVLGLLLLVHCSGGRPCNVFVTGWVWMFMASRASLCHYMSCNAFMLVRLLWPWLCLMSYS